MLIYISAIATNGNTASEKEQLANLSDACIDAEAIWRKGHTPFIPQVYVVADKLLRHDCIDVTYDEWLKRCLIWVAHSDAILYLRPSPGANVELAFAQQLGKPIYKSHEEVPDA